MDRFSGNVKPCKSESSYLLLELKTANNVVQVASSTLSGLSHLRFFVVGCSWPDDSFKMLFQSVEEDEQDAVSSSKNYGIPRGTAMGVDVATGTATCLMEGIGVGASTKVGRGSLTPILGSGRTSSSGSFLNVFERLLLLDLLVPMSIITAKRISPSRRNSSEGRNSGSVSHFRLVTFEKLRYSNVKCS
ncbi:hypothetical protein L596_013762 [Steinernema carpocapsae]|uniref:Uncharacterized protein n=1 Tax=Steinernema carpocapsae TaxID=34508 RepID=A0A4U5P161_STECR|nr:hypothetical protein L596_013762 [Steinernema carpocapsae]